MQLLPWIHVILFALWLGGDMGVFVASRKTIDAGLHPAARVTAAQIMKLTDLAPRTALVLIPATGLAMVLHYRGHGTPAVAGALAAGLLWWLLALRAWAVRPDQAPLLTRVDAAVRVLVGAGFIAWGASALATSNLPWWLAVKAAAFGVCVLSGLAIRLRLRPFGAAFGAVAAGTATPADEAALSRSLNTAMPFVVTIWGLVLLASYLGVVVG